MQTYSASRRNLYLFHALVQSWLKRPLLNSFQLKFLLILYYSVKVSPFEAISFRLFYVFDLFYQVVLDTQKPERSLVQPLAVLLCYYWAGKKKGKGNNSERFFSHNRRYACKSDMDYKSELFSLIFWLMFSSYLHLGKMILENSWVGGFFSVFSPDW